MEVPARVRRFVADHGLFDSGTTVVAALSGGSDSVALAYVLRDLEERGEVRLAGLAHFNHQLRATAARDEHACEALAESLRIPLLTDRDDVAARAQRERLSIEDAARQARYRFFDRARRHFGADRLALGHTRDDQAETFLLRLLRGAGPKGLGGMYPQHGWVVRPLLDCRRAELRAYLDARGITYVEDETNADVAIPRNRVRAELIPLIERRFNPSIVDVLADEAALARDQWAWMEDQLGDADLTVASLLAKPLALRRLIIWRAMTAASGGRPVAFRHVNAVVALLNRADDAGVDVPGQRVDRIRGRLVLTSSGARDSGSGAASRPPQPFRYPLPVPGEVRLQSGFVVCATETPAGSCHGKLSAAVGNGAVALVRRGAWRGELAVRNRRPGDRFRPVGLRGRKKLQDLFVDRKVARVERDTVPVVVDEADRIVWVAGHGIDDAFRVTDGSESMVILTLRQA